MPNTMCERCGRTSYSNELVKVDVETLSRQAWLCVPCARIVRDAILHVWPLPAVSNVAVMAPTLYTRHPDGFRSQDGSTFVSVEQ